MIKKILLTALFLLLALLPLKSYFHTGFPYTHDGENHLARFANYKIAIREGQFPPRLAPNLMNRYGYSVFNYNYPLANILSLPFSFLKINYELTFKILATTFVVVGMIGIFNWLELLKFKRPAIWFGLASYVLSPYLVSAIVYRGNIGEIAAIGLLPLVFYFVEKIRDQGFGIKDSGSLSAIIFLAAFFLSHNVTVLFAVPLLLLYAIFRYKKNSTTWKNFFFFMICSLLLTLWFWLPAIVEKNQIILDSASLSLGFTDHFVTLSQLSFSPLKFGFSLPGSIDTLGVGIGMLNILIFTLGLVITFKFLLQGQGKQHYLFLNTFFLISFLLIFQLQFTKIIWQIIPLAHFIQFPWRLSLFLTVFMPVLAALLWQQLVNHWKAVLLVFASCQALIIWRIEPVDYFHKLNRDYEAFSQSTSTLNENLPKSFTYTQLDWQPSPTILTGEGEIQIDYWTGSKREYLIKASSDVIVVEPTMNYLGWISKIAAGDEQLEYLNNDEIGGRIAYHLSAGEYRIKSQFTQNTWARRLGNLISLITLAGLIGYSLVSVRRHVKKNYS